MGYTPATDDGEVILTAAAERLHYSARAMAAIIEHSLSGKTALLWAYLTGETISRGRIWIKRERKTVAEAIGIRDDSNLRRALDPLIKAGLVDYSPGHRAETGWAGRISEYEINLEVLGYYDSVTDDLREVQPEPMVECLHQDDFSGLPDDDEDDATVYDMSIPRDPAVLPEEGIDPWTGQPLSNQSMEARHTPRGMQTGSLPTPWADQYEHRIMRAVGLA